MRQGSGKHGFPWGWVVLGVIVGAGIYWGPGLFHTGGAAPAGAAAQGGSAPVSTASVISKNVMQWSEFSGIFQAVNSAEIRPRVSGQIIKVSFRDGEEVKKGQPLFTIDPRPYEAAMVGAKASYTEAQASLGRAKKLIAGKAISRAEFETAQSAFDRAQGAYTAAQVNLDYTTITAPISGKISRAELTVGNQVEAGPSAPLMASIVDLSPIYASFDVDEQTFLATIQGVPAAKLKNIPVEIGLSNDKGTPIKASIHSFDNQMVPGSGTIRVRALVANKDSRLVPGLYARVRIGRPEEQAAVLINPAAVGTDQSKKFVMVVGEGNKAEYREVKLDGMVDGLQVITDGLKGGEQIVVNGLQRVRPGAPITPTEVDMMTLKPLNAAVDAPAAEGQKPADAKPADEKPADAKGDK